MKNILRLVAAMTAVAGLSGLAACGSDTTTPSGTDNNSSHNGSDNSTNSSSNNPVCNDSGNDGCGKCEDSKCCDEISTCEDDAKCKALRTCVANCADDACVGNCPSIDDDATTKKLIAIVDCEKSDCKKECLCDPSAASGADDCTACAATKCCDTFAACFGDSACSAIFDCVSACAGDTTCEMSCGMDQMSVDEYNALGTCVRSTCATECSG